MENAVQRVKEIVNQPVTKVPIGSEDKPAHFQPGWFHAGAVVPNFDQVDIRATQECAQYARWSYVTSDVTPGVMFMGAEVEFNAMTKFFYLDRSLPKKKLTEQEMLEVNGLYRVIGKCLKQIKEAQAQGVSPVAPDSRIQGIMAPMVVAAVQVPLAGSKAKAPDELEALISPALQRILAGVAAVLVLILVMIRVRSGRT
jgi:hypothetical protein